jgi:NTE family protein
VARPPRVGLVLGAGGLTGQAYHAGFLSALAEATGWDPRDATTIVGTSAGAAIGTYLRTGLSPVDGAALLTREPLTAPGAALIARLGPTGDWETPFGRLGLPNLPDRRLIVRLLTRPWEVRPETLVAVLMPHGRRATEAWAGSLRALAGDEWPARPLWICTVRVDDGRRVVFGREGAPRTDVATAVAASSAVPSYFEPVEIDDRRYLDGGVHSPTNADVLRGEDLDLALVCSPMSLSRSAFRPHLSVALRLHFRRRLASEVAALRRAGIPTVVFQPSGEDLDVMSGDAMDRDHERQAEVVRRAWATTMRRIRDEHYGSRLAPLAAA